VFLSAEDEALLAACKAKRDAPRIRSYHNAERDPEILGVYKQEGINHFSEVKNYWNQLYYQKPHNFASNSSDVQCSKLKQFRVKLVDRHPYEFKGISKPELDIGCQAFLEVHDPPLFQQLIKFLPKLRTPNSSSQPPNRTTSPDNPI